MFKKIISLALLVSVFSIASSANVYAQARMSNENQIISNNNDTKNEKLRELFLKKEKDNSFTVLGEKDNLANHEKQKSQGKKMSKGTKILIGVGIGVGVAILVGVLTTRFGINE